MFHRLHFLINKLQCLQSATIQSLQEQDRWWSPKSYVLRCTLYWVYLLTACNILWSPDKCQFKKSSFLSFRQMGNISALHPKIRPTYCTWSLLLYHSSHKIIFIMRREGPVLSLVTQFSKSTHSSSLIGQLESAALGSFNILTRHQPFYSFQQRICGK